jgi:hypothetical protein
LPGTVSISVQSSQSIFASGLLSRVSPGQPIRWPLPEGWDEEQVEAALYGSEPVRSRQAERTTPNFATLQQERQKSKSVTLQLLWEEYRAANPDGYQYSRFCYLYQRWRGAQDVVLRQEYKAGEKLFVDWVALIKRLLIQTPLQLFYNEVQSNGTTSPNRVPEPHCPPVPL